MSPYNAWEGWLPLQPNSIYMRIKGTRRFVPSVLRVFVNRFAGRRLSGDRSAPIRPGAASLTIACRLAGSSPSETAFQDGTGGIGDKLAEAVHGADLLQTIRRDHVHHINRTALTDQAVALAGLPDGRQRCA